MKELIDPAIVQLNWEKKWSRNFSFLLCSYLCHQYYEYTGVAWEGNRFRHVVFKYVNGVSTCYQLGSENKAIGTYLNTLLGGDVAKTKQWAEVLRQETDALLTELKEDPVRLLDETAFRSFQERISTYLPTYVRFIRAAACLPEEKKETVLPIMEEIRLYTDPVYDEIDAHLRALADALAKQYSYPNGMLSYLTREELIEGISTGNLPDSAILEKRKEGVGLFMEDGVVNIVTEQQVTAFEQGAFGFDAGTTEITGNTAHPGIVEGTVRIVLDPAHAGAFADGDILVAEMTHPAYLMLMKRAGAIVTDAGGVLCHAAVVAREFQIPCIIGTQIATNVLQDGEHVRVDATNGTVHRL